MTKQEADKELYLKITGLGSVLVGIYMMQGGFVISTCVMLFLYVSSRLIWIVDTATRRVKAKRKKDGRKDNAD